MMGINVSNKNEWNCSAYMPITWSRDDTQDTILQVKQHNAVWAALCGIKHTNEPQ